MQGLEALKVLDALPYVENDTLEWLVFAKTRKGEDRKPLSREWQANATMKELERSRYIAKAYLPVPYKDTFQYRQQNFLVERGYLELLKHDAEADWRWSEKRMPNPRTFCVPDSWEHDAWAVSLLTALVVGATKAGFAWHDLMDDKHLHRLKGEGVPFRATPDGFVVLQQGTKECPFFLEVDYGSEKHAIWQGKVLAYRQFITTDYDEQFAQLPKPIVLCLTKSATRMTNLMQTTTKAGGHGGWWFTTFDQLRDDPMGAIWLTADGELRSIKDKVERY